MLVMMSLESGRSLNRMLDEVLMTYATVSVYSR